MARNKQIELVSVTVKINGKKKTFKKEALSFSGWGAECDMCGEHGGVNMEIFEENKKDGLKSISKIELHSF